MERKPPWQDKVLLGDLEFYGHCGVSPEEREVGGRYAVDVELTFDLRPAGQSDDLSKTVNYAALYKLLRGIGEGERFQLLEALAERMAQAVLANFPVEDVRITLRKLAPPMAGFTGFAGVEIVRRPSDCGGRNRF